MFRSAGMNVATHKNVPTTAQKPKKIIKTSIKKKQKKLNGVVKFSGGLVGPEMNLRFFFFGKEGGKMTCHN